MRNEVLVHEGRQFEDHLAIVHHSGLPWDRLWSSSGSVARVRGVRECTRVQRALGVCAVVHVVSFTARGAQARLSPSAEGGQWRTPLLCTLAVQRSSVRQTPERERWPVEGGGETKRHDCARHANMVRVRAVCVVHVSRTARCAPLCVASLRVACYAWHIPPWI